jgi:valyl-tRNA synthetase
MVDKYSADCLRLWAGGVKLGEDMPFQEKDFIAAKKTTTKILNATKFAVMHLSDVTKEELTDFDYESLEPMDRWILSKSQEMIKIATEGFEKYEFSRAKSAGENFFWHDLCDNYLEICKDRLYNPDKYGLEGKALRRSAQIALYHSLLSVLKVLAPFASFITEEAYQMKFADVEGKKSIHISTWPQYDKKRCDADSSKHGDVVVDMIALVRKAKSDSQKSMNAKIKYITLHAKQEIITAVGFGKTDFCATIKADSIAFVVSDSEPKFDIEYDAQ